MNQELEQARREFLDECDIVVRSPATSFITGSDYSFFGSVLSIPIYVYVGLRTDSRGNDVQIMNFDGSVHFDNRNLSNMELLKSTNESIMHISDTLFDPIFTRNINITKEERKELTLSSNWSELIRLDNLKKITQKLDNFRLKIWSELPRDWRYIRRFCRYGRSPIIKTAFSTLIHCLENNIRPKEFNMLKKEYKKMIVDLKDGTLGSIAEHLTRGKNSSNLINDVFVTAWLLDYGSNGASCLGSLFGGSVENAFAPENRLIGLHYNIPSPQHSKDSDDLFDALGLSMIAGNLVPSEFTPYLIDVICNDKYQIAMPRLVPSHTKSLIIHWIDKEYGLFGSVLEPLFFDIFPNNIDIMWRQERSDEPSKFRSIKYEDRFLQILGPQHVIERIEAQILKGKFASKIYYNSVTKGWETEGTVVLEPEDYKLIAGLRKTRKELITISIEAGKPKVEIKNRRVKIIESIFARFLLCAVAQKQKKDFVSAREFYLSEGRQELTALKDTFERFPIIFKSKGHRVYFKIPWDIDFDRDSLCAFESEHYKWAKDVVDRFFKKLAQGVVKTEPEKLEKAKGYLFELGVLVSGGVRGFGRGYAVSTKMTSVVRNTDLIMNALRKLGWEFRDENWRREWRDFKTKVDDMLDAAGCEPLTTHLRKD